MGPLLLALGALSTFVSLAPLPGMPTWRDEQYTAISLLTLAAFAALLALFIRRGTDGAPPHDAAAEEGPHGREKRGVERRRRRPRR